MESFKNSEHPSPYDGKTLVMKEVMFRNGVDGEDSWNYSVTNPVILHNAKDKLYEYALEWDEQEDNESPYPISDEQLTKLRAAGVPERDA